MIGSRKRLRNVKKAFNFFVAEALKFMKKTLPLILLLICTNAYAQTYTVERIIDGDTIVVTTPEGKSETVELIGIDAPESQPNDKAKRDSKRTGQDLETINKMGEEATEFVQRLIKPGHEVKLVFDIQERDKYGRLLAYVWRIVKYSNEDLKRIRLGFGPLFKEWKHDEEYGWYLSFVNGEIIKFGYATPLVLSEVEGMTIPPNVKYADLFKELYEEARAEGRGLWKDE